jgi:hypothetical protein
MSATTSSSLLIRIEVSLDDQSIGPQLCSASPLAAGMIHPSPIWTAPGKD